MTTNRETLTIECASVDAEEMYAALSEAISAQMASDGKVAGKQDEPLVKIGRNTIRGADATTLAQFAIDVSVHVDVGKILYGVAAVLAALQARVVFRGKPKRIETEDDVAGLLEDLRERSSGQRPHIESDKKE